MSTKSGFNILSIVLMLFFILACGQDGTGAKPDLFQLQKVSVDGITLLQNATTDNVPVNGRVKIAFSTSVDTTSAKEFIRLMEDETDKTVSLNFRFNDEVKEIVVTPNTSLQENTLYKLEIAEGLKSLQGAEFPGTQYLFQTKKGRFELRSASLNGENLTSTSILRKVQFDDIQIELEFSEALDAQNFQQYFSLSPSVNTNISISADSQKVSISNTEPFDYYRFYKLNVSSNLTAANDFEFNGFQADFQTGLNPEYKFPEISDEQLLTKIQEQTFKYFWDFAHPVSGLSRERNTSGDVVTTGGSGFGLMAIIVGIDRGFISRTEGIQRLEKVINFLESADRFHGVWPHWMNGQTGEVIPFSTNDDGGDLVETAFLAQGLITVRQYLDDTNENEQDLIQQINQLLDTIEWDWYTRDGQNVLYWHWSPDYGWEMNMPIRGYNEALIVYVLAAGSKNHSVSKPVYEEGWARNGAIQNGNSFYGIRLPLGFDYGGPLFFAHYSFLGLDPRNLQDTYASYLQQNENHTLINRAHAIENPNNYVGYSAQSWGLTASDNPDGYLAHEPTRDNGTITPTAAISSIPYTPEESMAAIHHFYYVLGDKLWGEYGFHDAFNPTKSWWADSYLAIDQGPIIIMIENYRTGLLWNLFMSAPEVQQGLDKLDFTYNE